MKDLAPVDATPLFRPLHAELVELLAGLSPDDWVRPTLAPRWTVRDVAAHLLDGDLRRLSIGRDGHAPPLPSEPVEHYDELVAFLNRLNDEWIVATRRLSPTVLLSMLRSSGAQLADYFESLDPEGVALFPVAWAGERMSRSWMDIGREYTEKWHHQQQIRAAVGAPLLLSARWTRPLFELSVRSMPRAFQGTSAARGSAAVLRIEGDGGGVWSVIAERGGWVVREGGPPDPAAEVTVPAATAWKMFYNAMSDAERSAVAIVGDAKLGSALLGARSVMV
jgi:uncharacterized protein (TIGR03083 family)